MSASAAVLVMLGSRRYFQSPNCYRELSAARNGSKPLILVHESLPSKNGAPLDSLVAECRPLLREFVFQDRTVVPWLRAYDFQLVTLASIAEQMLLHTPAYASHDALSLTMPGSLKDRPLRLEQPVMLYASHFNVGAERVAAELQRHVREKADRRSRQVWRRSSWQRSSEDAQNEQRDPASSADMPNMLELTEVAPLAKGTAHFLLLLNSSTFDGRNDALVAEVRQALSAQVPFLLVHETDPAAGGVPFDTFFVSTPKDLVSAGLYQPLAVAWHPGHHRIVSLKLALTALGASRSDRAKWHCVPWCSLMSESLQLRQQGSEFGAGERREQGTGIGVRLQSAFSRTIDLGRVLWRRSRSKPAPSTLLEHSPGELQLEHVSSAPPNVRFHFGSERTRSEKA